MSNPYLGGVFEDVSEEGQHAREKFGSQLDLADERWLAILMEEVGEAATEVLRVGNPDLDALLKWSRDTGIGLAFGTVRNLRSVWTIATQPYPGAHFATFPQKLVEPCIKAGCPEGGVVLDPFAGSGTVGKVAQALSRRAVLIDLNLDYIEQAMARNAQPPLGLGT